MNPHSWDELTLQQQRDIAEMLKVKLNLDDSVPPGVLRSDEPIRSVLNRAERRRRAKAQRKAKP